VIALASELLQDPNNRASARDIITRQAAHVSRLVDDLLDAARVTSGRIVLDRQTLDLSGLVSGCIHTMRETGQINRHTVETDLETVWVNGDSARLSQIVMNLLGNAIKYTPQGGKIQVYIKTGQETVL
jgi:signal transduction histidine kinase